MVQKLVLTAALLSFFCARRAEAQFPPTIVQQKINLFQLNGSTFPAGTLPVSIGSATININTAAIEAQLIQLNGSVSSMTTNTNGLATEATSTATLAVIQQLFAQASSTKNVNVVNIPTVTIQGGFQINGSSISVQNVAGTSLTVRADDLNIRSLSFARDKVDVSGSSLTVSVSISTIAVTQGSTWTVVASSLDTRGLAFGRDKVDISGSTVTVAGISGSTLTVTFASTQPVSVSNVVGIAQAAPFSASVTSGTVTANVGTTGGLALDTTTASLFKQGQTIGNASFGAAQVGPWAASITSGSITANVGSTGGLALDTTAAAGFRQGQLIGNTTFQLVNSIVTIFQGGPLSVSASSPVPTAQSGPFMVSVSSGNIAVGQASPFVVSPSSTFPVAQAGPFTFSASSPVPVAQSGPFMVSQASVVAVAQSGPWAATITTGNVSGSSVAIYNLGGSSIVVRVAAGDGDTFTDTDANGHTAMDVFEISGSSQVAVQIQRQEALAGRYFSTTAGFTTFATSAETPLFLFVNLSTNTKAAFLDSVRFSFAGGNLGGGAAIFNVYRAPVITSSGTPVSIFPGDVNSGNVSQMQAFKSPTTSSNGTLVYTASTAGDTVTGWLNQSRIFRPGTKFLITITNPANNLKDSFDMDWSEE